MSIEWLLTKTAGTDEQRIPNNSHNEDKLSDQIRVSESTGLNEAAKDYSTDTTKIKKGFLGVLFGKFS